MHLIRKIIFALSIILAFNNLFGQTTFIGGGGNNNWDTPANWTAGIPTSADDVIIASGVTLDVNVNGECASITFDSNNANSLLSINTGITLNISGDINFSNPSADNFSQTIAVSDGNLICSSIRMTNNTNNTRNNFLTLNNGTISATGSIVMLGAAGENNVSVSGTGTINIGDSFSGGSFTYGNSTINYNGTIDQTIYNYNYYNLRVQNSGLKSLRANTNIYGNLIIDGVLNLSGYYARLVTGGDIQTNTSFGSSAMIDFQSGGYIWLDGTTNTNYEIIYPTGYGATYSPFEITSISGTDLNGDLYIRLYDIKHPLTNGINNAITRYWEISTAGLTITSTTGYFTYDDADVQAPITEGNLTMRGRLDGSGWQTNEAGTNYNHTLNQLTLTGVSTLEGSWTLGEASGCFDVTLPDKYTIASGNWNTSTIWNGGTVPSDGDNVAILHSTVSLNISPIIGNLIIAKNGDLYLNNQNITIQGTTDIYGQLRDLNGTNGLTRSFQDKLTVYNGGNFICTVDSRTFDFDAGIENDGTFQIANYTTNNINFNTANQIISGAGTTTVGGTITIASGLTLSNQVSEPNNGLIINGIINGADGTATFVNETVLSLQNDAASFATNGIFDANSVAGNTVKYNGNGNQNLIGTTYENLVVEDGNINNSNKTLTGLTIVNGDFSIESFTYFDPMDNNFSVNGNSIIKGTFDDDDALGITNLEDVDLSGGTINGGADGVLNINGTLSFPTGNATIGRTVLTVANTVTIPNSITLSISSNLGSKNFNNLIIENGAVFSNINENITVSGDLTVNSGGTFTQGTGTYTFDGTTKSIGGTITDLDFQNIIIEGTITNNIPDIDVAGNITVNSGSIINNGDISIGVDLDVSAGNYINNSITTVLDDIMGAGTLTQGTNSTLYIGDDATITTFNATANPNTVEYNGNGDQTINGGTYHHLIVRDGDSNNSSHTLDGNVTVNGDFNVITLTYFDPMNFDFTVNGSSTIAGVFDDDDIAGTTNLQNVDLSGGAIAGSAIGIINILGNLTLPTGDAVIGQPDLTVTGTITVPSGNTLTFNNANGNKIFLGDVIINGNWINSGNESFTLSGNLTVNNTSTFTQGAGTYTFDGTSKELNGTTPGIDFQNIIIDGTITNNIVDIDVAGDITLNSGSLTNEGDISILDDIIINAGTYLNNNVTFAGDDISGAGSFTQGDNSYLTIVDDADVTNFNASANGNTVEYYSTGGTYVRGNTYHHLIISQAGAATRYLDNAENIITINGDLTISNDAILRFQQLINQTLNVFGDVSGTGSIYFDVRNNIHNLNLSGASNSLSGFIVAGGNDFTVDYNGTNQQLISANNYDLLIISGSGTKTMQGDLSANDVVNINAGTLDLNSFDLTTSSSINIASGATLEVDENAQLLISNNQTLTNHGTFSVVGTSGNEAIVSINGVGNYYINQPTAGAEINAQYYQFNYLNNGIAITDGAINTTNNFSNGAFSNGIGSQYIDATGIDVSGLANISNTVFNSGPTYNITRTSGTGTMTFIDASGALAGENYDNDNGNPGSLIDWSYPGSTYYSQGDLPAGLTTSWNTNPGGGGSNPASVTDGLATLIVQDGHTITVDNNGDINVLALQVGEGTSGIFRIGEDGTQRTVTIQEKLEVKSGGIVNVVSTGSPSHQLVINGNLINDGTIDLRTTSSNVANTEFNGASSLISGSVSPIFNNITFKSGSNVTAVISLDVNNNVNLETGSVFQDGGLIHTVAGNWLADGTGTMTGTGTINFDGIVNTIEDGTAANFTFNNIVFSGGVAASIQENIIANNFEIDNSTTCNIANYSLNIGGDFTINTGSTFSHSANTTVFNGTSAQTLDFTGNVTFYNLYFSNGGANEKTVTGDFTANNRVTISAGSTVGGTGTYTIAGGLLIDGTCNFSGIVTLTGNYLLTNDASNTINLGTAELNIDGNVGFTFGGSATSLQTNVFNNVNINSGYLYLLDNTTLIGQPGNTFNLNASTILLLEGSDNFPTGFGTYNLDLTSRVDYQSNGDQTVRGNINYGILRFEINGTKTVDGPLDVDGELQLYDNTTLDLQNFDHTFASNITNEAGGCIILGSIANVTLDAADADQTVQTGTYSFNNLDIPLSSGTGNITKTFNAGSTIAINGDFNISNTLGSPSVILTVNFNDNGIGGSPNDFNLGSYCQFNTTNPTVGISAMDNFTGAKTLDINSTFYYSLNGVQSIADGFTYGNLTFNGGNKTAEGSLDINGDIFQTANTPVFYDAGFTHYLQGNWLLNNTAYYTQASATGTIVFDGSDQEIQGVNFNNITISNSGVATLQNNITVYGDLSISNGGTLDANIRNINIHGNWLVNPSGLFTQSTGTTTFIGSVNQTLTSNANSYFGLLTINKPNPAGNQTVSVLSELHVNGFFRITANAGVFDVSNQNAYFGGYFYVYNNTVEAGNPFISTNSTVYFNGGDAQNIYNADVSDLVFNNIILEGAGDKTFDWENGTPSSRIVDVNGDFSIIGSSVSGNGFADGGVDFTVAGNWSNTGSFSHNNARTVTFDGGNQNLSSSSFGNVIFAGTDTKTLQGNISLSASLTINDGVTLDANNNGITLAGTWDNDALTSVFIPGNATVTFEGNTADIFAGTGAGKSFYDVIVNKNAGQTADMETDLEIYNNLTISSGYLRTQSYNIWLGGDFVVSGGIFNHNDNNSRLTLNASGGTKLFDPGASGTTFRGITIDATGATYSVQNDFTISQNQDFILNDGYFDLNGNKMTVVSNNQTILLNGGTFDIDEGATVSFANANQQISIAGGTFRLVGSFASNASLTRTGGSYTVSQTSGTFHAQYYRVELCNGISISGGSIDGANNFSNGTFTNGFGNAYLTLTGLDFADFNPTNVMFNSGPTYNVSRTSGTGVITFEDSFGALAGENYDEDNGNPGTLIEWIFPTGFFWDGGDLVDNEDWNLADNWSGNTVPTNSNLVILNHDYIAGNYTVRIKSANADAYRLILDDQGTGNGIELILENAFDLNIDENVYIGSNTILTQTDNSNTITIGQNYINEGTLNHGNSSITFDGPAGSFTIDPGGSGAGKSFYNFTINATGATYRLSDVLDVDNNLTVTDGTFDLATNTNDITVGGDWTIDLVSGAVFVHSNADVTLDGNEQTIDGGTFYNLLTLNGGTKQLISNIDVDNNVVIGALTTLDAQDKSIYVGNDWTNNGLFAQTGLGEIIFDGAQGQNIDNGSAATDFNYLTFTNAGAKTFYNSSNVNADFTINSGSGTVDVGTYTITGVGATNSFTLNSTLNVHGANNFPSGFETISLASNSWVDYLGTIDQTIYSTTYGNLRLRSSGATTTKTAAGDLVLLGQLDMDNDALTTLDMNANSANMTIAGNITVVGDDIIWGTGTTTLTHNGADWNIDADIATFNNLILSGSGNKWMQGDLNITGDVTVQNGTYLRMYQNNNRALPHTMTGLVTKSFTLENGARCYSAIAEATGPAIPNSFGTYNLADNSNYYLYSPDGINQTLFTGSSIKYGNLYFNGVKDVTSDGIATLDVNGIFDISNSTYYDNGQNMKLAGAYSYFTNYTPSASSIVVNLDGSSNQQISDDINNTINIGTLICSGSATKTLCDGNDILNISGNVTINAGVDVTCSETINFSGANWTNNGTFSHTAQTINFNGTTPQNINPGASNPATYFNNIYFDNPNTVTFNINGADINGTFTINDGTVDLGTLNYTIAGTITNTASTLTSNLANITLDGWNQNVNTPDFSAANVTVSGGGGTKRMFSDWTISGNLTIEAGTYLNTSDNVIPTYYDLYIGGNWTCDGFFVDNTSTVTFNGSSSPINIASGGSNFYNINFNPGAAVSYHLTSPSTRIARAMDIQSSATLNLNSNTLILGSNIAAGKTYNVDGRLNVNENALLQFNNQTSQSVMNVSGTLEIIGSDASNLATISREVAGVAGSETQINILNSGTLAARYYLIEYLQDAGLIMQAGSILDATNNLSNGTWSNIRNAAGVCYINMECDYAGADITDITFNYSGTPVQGTHYNVRRNIANPDISFDNVSGNLGSYLYEDDEDAIPSAISGKLRWPAFTETYWTGAINSDWHTAGNWDNGVPTNAIDAIIPNRSNDPIISSGDAECKNLTITDGSLILDNDRRLDAYGDVTIGTAASVGILTVNTSNSVIAVGGFWTRGTNGIFGHGDGTVIFNSSAGSATILPRSSNFYKVQFDNALTTFYLSGATITFEDDFEILNGIVSPSTNNYTYYVEGDFNNAGTYTPTVGGVTAGTIEFNGSSDQNITGGEFYNLTISGSGNKITNGVINIANQTTVSSTLQANAGSNIDFNGNVTIDIGATFNDGGETHTFTGQNWTGDGSYAGAGTLVFDRTNSNQNIYSGTFNNLIANCTGRSLDLFGDITINNNLTLLSGVIDMDLNTYNITNSAGTGTFTMEDNVYLYVSGANNFPSNFGTYSIGPNTRTYYNATIDQYIAPVNYGHLYLYNENTKTLTGDILINGNLYIYTNSTLDVTSNNYNIEILGTWDNDNSNGIFLCHEGEVKFRGSTSNQNIYIGTLASNEFYDVTVNNSGGYNIVANSNVAYTIRNNLHIENGNFNGNGRTIYVGGDLLASGGGSFSTNGNYVLNSPNSSPLQVGTNGSTLLNLTIDSPGGATYDAQDNISLNGDFNLNAGTFNGNGNTITLGNGTTDIISIIGTYQMGEGGILAIGYGTSLTINAAGNFEAVGTPSNIVTITRNLSGGRYNFTVDGNIAAQYYMFEWMSSNGIYLSGTSAIDATNHFSNGTFTNGANTGQLFRVENTQDFSGANRIENVSFPINPGGSAANVTKNTAGSGTLEFYNSTGAFAGEIYDLDPNNLINWTGPITLTWNGSVSTNWNDAANWTASSGPNIVPTGAEDVIIAPAVNQPILTTFGAITANLTINSGATLILNTPADAGATDLDVNGDLNIIGTLRLNTTADYLTVEGNWTKTGNVVMNGNVTFDGSGGSKTINNGNVAFYNLTIGGTSTYQLAINTTIANNMVINSGAKLDVTAIDYDITVKGNWINNGTFYSQDGVVIFNATSGTRTIYAGTSSFNDIEINASGVTYQLTSDLSVKSDLDLYAGTLDFNTQNLNMGDGVNIDYFTITGTCIVDENASLRMGANASLNVNSGGTINVVGSDAANVATVTRQSTGNYSFDINSGGTINAQYYLFEYMDADGIYVHNGASVGSSNDFSNGTFANGFASGTSLKLEHDVAIGEYIDNVVFNSGSLYNVTRTTGTNEIYFSDASGTIGSYLYELDDFGTPDASNGLLRWEYINTNIWDGDQGDNNWHNPLNWSGGVVPDLTKNAIIPNVTYDPIISTGTAEAKRLSLETGAVLTINNQDFTVAEEFYYNGSVVAVGSPTITVGDNWTSSSGSFTADNSTVVLNAIAGTRDITIGTDKFYNLEINSGGTYRLNGALSVENNVTITAGTLNSNGYNITLSGDWTNNANFIEGTRTVTFNATSGTHDIDNGSDSFYNVVINSGNGSGNATFRLQNDLDISYNLTISKGTLDLSPDGGVSSHNLTIDNRFSNTGGTLLGRNAQIQVGENWLITGSGTFTCGTSTVNLISNAGTRTVNPGASNFYNLTISGIAIFRISNNTVVQNDLDILSGTFDVSSAPSYNLTVGGDWTNTGSFNERLGTVTLNGTDQTLTNAAGETFYRLNINNSSLTFANGNVTVSNTLNLTNGNIITGLSRLTLGTSTSNIGTLNYTSGTIVGEFERWLNSLGTDYLFPVGTITNNNSVIFRFLAGLTSGSLVVELVEANPGTSGLPLDDAGYIVNNIFPDGYWDVTARNAFACTDYNLTLDGTGFTSLYTIDADTRIVKRTNNGDWNLTGAGTHAAAVNPICNRNALNGISTLSTQFALALRDCIGGTISNPASTICENDDADAFVNDESPSGGSGYTYTWQSTNVLTAVPGDANWTDIGSGLSYDPGTLTQSTMFVRKAEAASGCVGVQYSNTITITVNLNPNTGAIYHIANDWSF